MADWKEKDVEAVVGNVVDASNTVRRGLVLLNLACLIAMLGLWNQTLNWSAWTEQDRLRAAVARCEKNNTPNCTELKYAHETVTRLNWDQYNSLSVPVIGMRLDSDDIPVLGSSGILILITWWWWGLRRQNRATRAALDLIKKDQADLNRYVQHRVEGSFVFLTATKTDDQVDWAASARAQREREKDYRMTRALHKVLGLPSNPSDSVAKGTRLATLMRLLEFGILILPAFTVAFTLGMEIWLLSRPSWVMEGNTFWQDLAASKHELAMLVRLAFGTVVLVAVVAIVRDCLRWARSTILMVKQIALETESPGLGREVSGARRAA